MVALASIALSCFLGFNLIIFQLTVMQERMKKFVEESSKRKREKKKQKKDKPKKSSLPNLERLGSSTGKC